MSMRRWPGLLSAFAGAMRDANLYALWDQMEHLREVMLWQAHLRLDENLCGGGDVGLLRREVVVPEYGQISVQIVNPRPHLPLTACWAPRVQVKQPRLAIMACITCSSTYDSSLGTSFALYLREQSN